MNGQATTSSAEGGSAARSRADCSATMPAARSSSAAWKRARSPAARSAVASSSRAASGAGPAARGAVDALRHALALAHQPRERRVVAVLARDRGDRGGVERAEREIRVRGGLDRHEHELRAFDHERLLGDEQDRPPGALDLFPRGVRRAGSGGVDHAPARGLNLRRKLGGEARLADPRRAGEHEPPAAPPGPAQRVELRLATEERRGGVELRRQLRRQVERGVLAEDRVVEAPELGAGLDADRLDEHRAGVPVRVQRGGLAAAAVQREHPQAVQSFAQRLADHQRVQLADHVGVAPGGEVLADRLLDRREPQLLQPADLERRERLRGDVVERRPAPQRERVARRARGDEALEAADVEIAPIAEPQLVAAPARDDLRAIGGGRERLAEVRDVALDHLRRAGRRGLTPQPVDQLLGRDRHALAQREHRQERPRLARADRDGLIAVAGLHGSEHSKIHGQGSLSDSTLLAPARAARADLPRSTAALPARYRGPRRCLSSGPPPPRRGFR